MEGAAKDLVMSRRFSLVLIIGLIGIFAAPFTQQYGPSYPTYHISVFQELNDDSPMWEFAYPLADKIVIEALTTNDTPVTIKLYDTYFSEVPSTNIENITEIQNIFLVGAGSETLGAPVIRVSHYSNQSVHISITSRMWVIIPSTDYISIGPSIFLFLAIPLVYFMYRYWGYRLKKNGYPLLFLIILSAVLMTPFFVYSYNGGASSLRHDDIQETHPHIFILDATNPHQEFPISVNTTATDTFVRIAEIETNSASVSITVDSNEDSRSIHLSNITVTLTSQLQIELPRGNFTEFTLQFDWIGQNASISFTIETVTDIWVPWIDPVPYYQAGLAGLVAMVISLVIPRNREFQLPDKSSLS